MDSNYVFDQAKLSLYVDDVKQGTINVNVLQAATGEGFSGSFNYTYGNEVIIKLEDTKYNGKVVNTGFSAKFKNY